MEARGIIEPREVIGVDYEFSVSFHSFLWSFQLLSSSVWASFDFHSLTANLFWLSNVTVEPSGQKSKSPAYWDQ